MERRRENILQRRAKHLFFFLLIRRFEQIDIVDIKIAVAIVIVEKILEKKKPLFMNLCH